MRAMSDKTQVVPPIYEQLTSEYASAFSHHVNEHARREGVLSTIASHVIHEGRSAMFTRSDGTTVEMKMHKMGDEFELSFDEIQVLEITHILVRVVALAESMKRQQSEMIFRELEEATKSTGQVIDGKGKPLNFDSMMAARAMMPASYDPVTGESNLSMVISPGMLKGIESLKAEFESSPEQQKQLEELERRKRDEFRREEMARSLVG